MLNNWQLSCTVTIGETVLFFGGNTYGNQISQLTPRGIRRIETLPFDLKYGTCLVKGRKVFLGFNVNHRKSCWSRFAKKCNKFNMSSISRFVYIFQKLKNNGSANSKSEEFPIF